jgi:hypothetical protein
MLLRKEKDETVKKNLLSGYDMITNPEKMGERFKFFAMLSSLYIILNVPSDERQSAYMEVTKHDIINRSNIFVHTLY